MANETLATIESRTYYEVRGECDTNEGRGGTYLVGHFIDPDIAAIAANGKGVWGGPGNVKRHDAECAVYKDPISGAELIRPLGPAILLQREDPGIVRDRALKKLSPAEKLALGLK